MNKSLSFFNLSLQKLLLTEANAFNRAKLKILYIVLMFALLKTIIVLIIAYHFNQHFQLERGFVALIVYSLLLKFLLINKSYFKTLIHLVIWFGLLIIWSNIFVSVQGINIITLQFVFMVIVSSFYFIDSKYLALFYSFLSSLPIIIFLIVFNNEKLHIGISAVSLAAPGNLIIVVINFITLITAHYLFIKAIRENIDEKECLNIQLTEAVQIANRYAQSKSDFLSTMSHELRTPLNSVIGITDLLLDNPISKEQKENLNILHFSAVSLNSLINDIRLSSNINSICFKRIKQVVCLS